MANIFNYQIFGEVFDFDPECSYSEDTVHDITTNRNATEGLFIDKVLKILQIKRPSRYYPPKSNNDLRSLHKIVCENTGPDHHKLSVLYYILLDLDHPTGRRLYSTSFEQRSFLPQKYQIYMKGLWHMDHQEYETALQYLTHPSLIPTFADDILEVLVRKGPSIDLALAYYHTCTPTLTSKDSIECLYSALARTSITEAFYFSRAQSPYSQRHMFEILISLVLNNSSPETIVDRSVELINLPLTTEEEGWFEEYLLRGDGRSLKKSKDTVLMRKIGMGDFRDAMKVKGQNGKQVKGLDWGSLMAGIENGLGPRADI